jgi:muconolactone delta-isomerase
MQFLTLSRRRTDTFPPEAFTPKLLAHEGARVRELHAAGILRQIWLRGDVPGASILWEADSEADVRAAIDSLPIFKAGMLEILALVPLKPYPGFAPPK